MSDEGIIVVSLHEHEPVHWERLVQDNPQAVVLEVHIGDITPTARSLESLSRLAEVNGLALRMRE